MPCKKCGLDWAQLSKGGYCINCLREMDEIRFYKKHPELAWEDRNELHFGAM